MRPTTINFEPWFLLAKYESLRRILRLPRTKMAYIRSFGEHSAAHVTWRLELTILWMRCITSMMCYLADESSSLSYYWSNLKPFPMAFWAIQMLISWMEENWKNQCLLEHNSYRLTFFLVISKNEYFSSLFLPWIWSSSALAWKFRSVKFFAWELLPSLYSKIKCGFLDTIEIYTAYFMIICPYWAHEVRRESVYVGNLFRH